MGDVAGSNRYYASPQSGDSSEESPGTKKMVLDEAQVSATIPMTALMQPLIFSRTLMQVGYEPLEPEYGVHLIWRKPGYYYPNIFKYANHIRKTEGSIFVLFTGMTPKILNTISATITDRSVDKFIREKLPYTGEDASVPMHRKNLGGTLYEMAVNCASKSAAVVVSHPFHVVMVRMICSVISKDQAYQGLFSTVKEIYKEEGLAGFYSGFTPRWLAEMLTVTLGGSIMYGIYRTMTLLDVEEESVRSSPNYNALVQFSLGSLVYKYQLTAAVTAATCSGLHIGLNQHKSWTGVFSDLKINKQLARGSAYFYRKAVL